MQTRALPYHPDSSQLFSQLLHLSHPILLDGDQRYHIMTACPSMTLTRQHQKTILRTSQDTFISDEDIFTLTERYLKRIEPTDSDLPFTVGAIGLLNYELGHELEHVPTTLSPDLHSPNACIGLYDWSIVTDHEAQTTTLQFLEEPPTLRTYTCKPFELNHPFSPNITEASYHYAFDTIQSHLRAGNNYQTNLTQRFSSQFTGDPWHAYQTLRQNHPAPFSAFLRHPQGDILCFSPEQFIEVSKQHAHTRPIKGTTPVFSDPAANQTAINTLCSSEKERAENTMIVDLLRNDFGKVCEPGSVHVSSLCALETFNNVHHLVSEVNGELPAGTHPLQLLKACFPGGSITGAPKKRTMEIIQSVEAQQRGPYCGSLFYCDVNGHLNSNILIRSLITARDEIHAYAGGGIVADSTASAEYQESLVKIKSLLTVVENLHTKTT